MAQAMVNVVRRLGRLRIEIALLVGALILGG